jgi:hypothetical protein
MVARLCNTFCVFEDICTLIVSNYKVSVFIRAFSSKGYLSFHGNMRTKENVNIFLKI